MFVGHFGVGFAAKRAAPAVSLGTFLWAVLLADALWTLFLLLGLEHVRITPGVTAVNPLDLFDYPWSHSLAALMVWSAAFGGFYWLGRRDGRAALLLGGAVLSHWVLDVVAHRPDVPVGLHGPYLGLGLWQSVSATVLVEGGLYFGGLAVYLRATRATDWIGRYALATLVLLLTALWVASLLGPPPPDAGALAASNLIMWLVVPWAYWIDRHRPPRAAAGRSGRRP